MNRYFGFWSLTFVCAGWMLLLIDLPSLDEGPEHEKRLRALKRDYIRFRPKAFTDPWGTPVVLRGAGETSRCQSAGPDLAWGTLDDVTIYINDK